METVEAILRGVDAMNGTTKALMLALVILWLVSPYVIVLMMRAILGAQRECLKGVEEEKHLLISFVTKHYPENQLPYKWPPKFEEEKKE